jgi:pimeloyl-ACP methyl ester carboxylesterase
VHAADLHGGLVVARASMLNYRAVVSATANLLPPPRTVCGWSMGGLAAMMAAEAADAERLVLLEPSAPREVRGPREVELVEGVFDPVALYGPFPAGILARAESALARAERERGISVPSLPCPTLVVYGDEFTEERGRAIARAYGADELHFAGLDHWGLVLEQSVPEAVRTWLGKKTTQRRV